jgi:hypothetical protein
MDGVASPVTTSATPPSSAHDYVRAAHHHVRSAAWPHVSNASRQRHQQRDAQPGFEPATKNIRHIHAVLLLLFKHHQNKL